MTEQAKTLRDARAKLDVTSAELAEMIGVSLPTLRSWIAPETSKMHRTMPIMAKLLLDRLVKERKKGKG